MYKDRNGTLLVISAQACNLCNSLDIAIVNRRLQSEKIFINSLPIEILPTDFLGLYRNVDDSIRFKRNSPDQLYTITEN